MRLGEPPDMQDAGKRLVLSLLLVVRDVEELDLVALLGGGDNTEPVTKLLLAQVLLSQVLEVTLREGNVGVDPDLAFTCNSKECAKRLQRWTNAETQRSISRTRELTSAFSNSSARCDL